MKPPRAKPDIPPSAEQERVAPSSSAPDIERTAERRRSSRFSCNAAITMNWGDAVLNGRVVDISAEGMFVQLEEPLWIGASFTAQLGLDTSVGIECVVRRIQPFRGMALTYSVPSEAGRAAVAAFLGDVKPT